MGNRVVLDPQVQRLRDAGGSLEIGEVLQQERWRSTDGTFNAGFSDAAWWLRVELTNPTAATRERLLEIGYPLLDRVEVYQVRDGRVRAHDVLGDRLSFDRRPLAHHHFVLPVRVPAESSVDLYLRVRSVGSVQVPLTLWEPQAFAPGTYGPILAHGLLFGALLAIAGYNLLLFGSLRDRTYLYYVGYVVGIALFLISSTGFALRYLWPSVPAANDYAIVLSLALLTLFANLFVRRLLDIPALSRRFDRLNLAVIGLAVLVAFAALLLPFTVAVRLAIVLVILSSAYGIVVGPVSWWRGHPAGGRYTLAWTAVFVGAFALAFTRFGLLPANWLTNNGLDIGVAFEVLLLSLALGDRINAERHERVRAEQDMLEAQKEAHAALERRVAERDAELDELNQELVRRSHTDPLTQLSNRRYLSERLEVEWSRCRRQGVVLACVLLDVDHFKRINDSLGHEAGDTCLCELAHRIAAARQHPEDVVARYGGEEFCLLLPETSAREACEIAERLRTGVAAHPVAYGEREIDITVSLGVAAVIPSGDMHADQLLLLSDEALYRAKNEGRNRVHLARSEYVTAG